MNSKESPLEMRFARSEADLLGAQRLRYRVFVEELGGDGDLVDHARRLECDRFDSHFEHLILVDPRRDEATLDHVVGVYRLMTGAVAAQSLGFYSDSEFDLDPLLATGRNLMELGRSCVEDGYRGGPALMQLWSGVAEHVAETGTEILFGVASFHGTDLDALAAPLSWLHHKYLAPEPLRVRAKPPHAADMDRISEADLDRVAAARAIPALIKGYLRLGGYVGAGAYVDHSFNTTDICLVMDISRVDPKQRALYGAQR